jgi:hypothetical protein
MFDKNNSYRELTGCLRRIVAGNRVGCLIKIIVAESRHDG